MPDAGIKSKLSFSPNKFLLNIIPFSSISIDRIFLEESSEDTDNDGVADLQTPKISIQLKMLDSENADGSYFHCAIHL